MHHLIATQPPPEMGGETVRDIYQPTTEDARLPSPKLANELLQDEASLQTEVALRVPTPSHDPTDQPLEVR